MGHAVVAKLLAKGQGALQIVVVSEENYPAYNRVKLTTFFEHRDPNQLALSSLALNALSPEHQVPLEQVWGLAHCVAQ